MPVSDAGNLEAAYWQHVPQTLYEGRQMNRDYQSSIITPQSVAGHDCPFVATDGGSDGRSGPDVSASACRSLAAGAEPSSRLPQWKRFTGLILRSVDVSETQSLPSPLSTFMCYANSRSCGSRSGSGIIEPACEQNVTGRPKLSGMRWTHNGAAQS